MAQQTAALILSRVTKNMVASYLSQFHTTCLMLSVLHTQSFRPTRPCHIDTSVRQHFVLAACETQSLKVFRFSGLIWMMHMQSSRAGPCKVPTWPSYHLACAWAVFFNRFAFSIIMDIATHVISIFRTLCTMVIAHDLFEPLCFHGCSMHRLSTIRICGIHCCSADWIYWTISMEHIQHYHLMLCIQLCVYVWLCHEAHQVGISETQG
jgi:hypothetical protein